MKNNKKLVIAIIAIVVCVAVGLLIYLNKDINFGKRNENSNPTPAKENQELKLVKYADYVDEPDTQVYSDFYDDGYIVLNKSNDLTDKVTIDIYQNGEKKEIAGNICIDYMPKLRGINDFYVCATEDGERLFNYKTQKVGDEEYYTIYDDDDNSGYFYVTSEVDAYGLLDSNGKEIFPQEYEDIRAIKTKDGKTFFVSYEIDFEGEEESVVFDENKNIVFKVNDYIWYSDYYDTFYTLGEGELSQFIRFYSLNGELIKEFNKEEFSSNGAIEIYYYNYFIINDFVIFVDKNEKTTVYIIDDKLNLKKYENVYYNEETIKYFYPDEEEENTEDAYYITDKFIVIKENDKYIVKSIASDEILGEYSSIEYHYIPIEVVDEKMVSKSFIACKENNKCGIIDSSGNKIIDFIYEYNKENKQLTNNNEHLLIPTEYGNAYNASCSSFDEYDDVVATNDYLFITEEPVGEYNIYNYKCEKIIEKTISDYKYYDDGLIIAELDWNETDDDIYVCEYAIFYKGKEITYKSEDNAKIHQLLGYNDKKIYFTTDKGIYYIDISSLD